jgi:hypothetical protein
MGARPLARIIDNKIKSPLSRRVLFGDLVDGGRVSISVETDELTFTVSPVATPLPKESKKTKAKKTDIIENTSDEVKDN